MSIKSRVAELEKPRSSRPLVIKHKLHNMDGIKKAAKYHVENKEHIEEFIRKGGRYTVKNFASSNANELLQKEIHRLQSQLKYS